MELLFQILKQGVLDILRKFLILDGTDPAGEETTTHVLLVLGLLADAGNLILTGITAT